ALVTCEDWRQWVIEDHFVAGRPEFERAGAVFTDAVHEYEAMKVGLLNGGHTVIAHFGLMLGHDPVHDAMADARVRDWLVAYQGEVAPTIAAPRGVDLAGYRAALLRRFANPAIGDRLVRLASDTCEKMRQVL